MFRAAKDAFTGAAARKLLSARIARYGKVAELRIDSRRKTVEVVCDLIGEAESITVRVGRYDVEESEGKTYVRPIECSCSRPWITHLLEDFIEGQRFEVPHWARAAL